jgi:hypothetical protein
VRFWVIPALCVLAACALDRGGFAPPVNEDAGVRRTDAGTPTGVDDGGFLDARGLVDGGGDVDGGAGLDAGETPRDWVVVETMVIACDSASPVESDTALGHGRSWKLRASGTCVVNDSEPPIYADADYVVGSVPLDVLPPPNALDIGLGVDDDRVDGTTTPDWGAYDPGHVYTIDYPATSARLSIRFHDSRLDNNSGELTLEILEFR